MLFSTMLKRSHGVLYLRRVVPAKLRDIIGKREIRISLKTRVECSPIFCSGGELKLTARPGRLKPRFSGVPR